MTLAFTVYGVAQSKGNMRAINLKGMKFPVVTESNRSAKSWQQLIAAEASHALQQLPASERGLLPYGVRLTIAFYMPRPKKHAKRGVFVPHTVAPDIDKLERAVLDALTQVLYHDDKQVTEVIKGKYYADVDDAAHVNIRVEPAPGRPLVAQPINRPLFELMGAT
jgi:crossover junction endodeoxyribonuclease RusA